MSNPIKRSDFIQSTKAVSRQNRVVSFVKNKGGSMTCTQRNGNTFTIDADMLEVQAFVVFTMIDYAESPEGRKELESA